MVAVGIDGCKDGWIAVVLNRDARGARAHFVKTIDRITDVVLGLAEDSVIAIDIPIGLPVSGHRKCDLLAKKMLEKRAGSVFLAPPRDVLSSSDHKIANERAHAMGRPGVSQQMFALREKIFEVEEWLPKSPCRVCEVHPEVSFRSLIGREAAAPKRSWAGMVERRNALASIDIHLDGAGPPASLRAAADDMLDAAVVAWTAVKILRGEAMRIPEKSEPGYEQDEMTIWVPDVA